MIMDVVLGEPTSYTMVLSHQVRELKKVCVKGSPVCSVFTPKSLSR